jgi:alkylhydroperoxidase family enzyme
MDIRRAVGAKQGIPLEKLDALVHYSTSNQFTARERAALEYAEAITRDDRDVTDACVGRLREHFSEAEVVELTFIVGYQTFASKFAKAFRLAPQGFAASA